MGDRTVNLVVEDALSEAFSRRILAQASLESGIVYGKQGFGYIKTRLAGFNNGAKSASYFVLADLDQFQCPAGLWAEWLPNIRRHRNLIFRVAVREVESWLLADYESLKEYLGLKENNRYSNTDELPDPKREFLSLALRSSKRTVREAVVFQNRDGTVYQGPDYNGALIGYVEKDWSLSAGMRRSNSLARAVRAVSRFAGA